MSSCFFCFKEMLQGFPEALAAGMILAVSCTFIGVFMILKRGAFLGATLSQTAACGIAAALCFHFEPYFGALLFTFGAVTFLAHPWDERRLSRDAVMALIFVTASAMSLLFVAKSAMDLEEIKSLLYGDLLVTTREDLRILIWAIGPVFLLLCLFVRPVLYTFLDREGARALNVRVRFWEFFFFYLSALIISLASKFGGMLLVFGYLVIPSMAGLLLARRFLPVMATALFTSLAATLMGFSVSYAEDLPTNPVILIAAFCFLLAALILKPFIKNAFKSIKYHKNP